MKILIVLILVLFFASLWDLKNGKIPNLLIVIGVLYGLMRMLYYQNLFAHIWGIMFPILILYPFFKIGTIGAGDIKLFSLIGCYVSFMESIYCMFLAFILGAIFSLISMKQKGHFTDRISYLMSYLKESFSQKQFRYYYQDLNKFSPMEIKKTKVHLALPIFVSVCIHLGGVFL